MKKIILMAIGVFAFSVITSAREIPVTFEQLPAPAQTFITTNFADDPVLLAVREDDLVRPDYEIRLTSGAQLEFDHSGALKKIASRNGIAADLIPDSIRTYVTSLYPNAKYLEYEIGRYTYEVTLSNGWELKFNSRFNVIEIDD